MNLNRHARRRDAAIRRARARALSRMMTLADFKAFQESEETAAVKELVLLRVAYRAVKLDRITTRQARLFGCKVKVKS